MVIRSDLGRTASHNKVNDNTIFSNTGSSNNGDGVIVDGSAPGGTMDNNKIANNDIYSNQRYGIALDATNCTVSNSSVTDNDSNANKYGIIFGSGVTDTKQRDNTTLGNTTSDFVDGGTRTSTAGKKINNTDAYYRISQGTSIIDFLQLDVNPADAGVLRIPNNSVIRARNAANTGNVAIAQVNNGDVIVLGESGIGMAFPGGFYVGAATGGDKGDGSINAVAYYANGVGPYNGDIAVRNSGDSGTSTITVTNGIVTGFTP